MARRDDDDDDDDRPSIKKKHKKSEGGGNTFMILLIAGGVLGLSVCCGGGILIVLFATKVAPAKLNEKLQAKNPDRKRKAGNQDVNIIARGKVVLNQVGNLTANDPLDPSPELREVNAHMKVFQVAMQPGKTYVIIMTSDEFDAYLRIESPAGKQLAEDDDSAGDLNAMIVFRPEQAGMYRVIATSWDGETGQFRLKIQEAD